MGAPWLDGELLSRELNGLDLPGVSFFPLQFTPNASKFENELCSGVSIVITDRKQFDSIRTGLEIALQLRRLYPQVWEIDAYDRLLGNMAVLDAIKSGLPYSDITGIYRDELAEFIQRRSQFLIYE